MASDRTNILVAARVRPLLGKEGSEPALQILPGDGQSGTIVIEKTGINKRFTFDYVFGPKTEQTEVFESVKPLVESVLDGYNATVLAYGQTGSGKTFTMGTDALSLSEATAPNACADSSNRKGVVSRATDHLFSLMAERRSRALTNGQPVPEFSVSVVFVEIYNDDIIDLLTDKKVTNLAPNQSSSASNVPNMKKSATVVKSKFPPKKANVRCNENGEIILDGVTTIGCESSVSVLSCLQEGSLARRTATTAFNERSSRSHAIFTIVVNQHRFIKPTLTESTGNSDDLCDEVLVAKMHFVDLAGSERLHEAVVGSGSAAQERFREGVNINMGLLTLGKVISLLSDGKTQQQHIPYRDSKLTRLLQDSLGGNSKTLMIACVSAADCFVEQSINTLQYATNAQKIKNQAIVNRASSVAQLRAEINMLRRRLEARNGNIDPEITAELVRLRQENEEYKLRVAALTADLDRRKAVLCCEAYSQTEKDVISREAIKQAIHKARSTENSDSTLTDSKIQLDNSFRYLIDKVISEGAECIALREQANIFSPNQSSSRFLSENSDIGRIRESRRKRKTELMASNASLRSSNSVAMSSISENDTTPSTNNRSEESASGKTWDAILNTVGSTASHIDEDDEFRDPTYEPTPLRKAPADPKVRRRFEQIQDAMGNRRLTRAADRRQFEPESYAKKSRFAPEPSEKEEENRNVGSDREYCHCHGFCKVSRCACRKAGKHCVHSSDGSSGCNCDVMVCVNTAAHPELSSSMEAAPITTSADERESGSGKRRHV